jgi:hypothetical protein
MIEFSVAMTTSQAVKSPALPADSATSGYADDLDTRFGQAIASHFKR